MQTSNKHIIMKKYQWILCLWLKDGTLFASTLVGFIYSAALSCMWLSLRTQTSRADSCTTLSLIYIIWQTHQERAECGAHWFISDFKSYDCFYLLLISLQSEEVWLLSSLQDTFGCTYTQVWRFLFVRISSQLCTPTAFFLFSLFDVGFFFKCAQYTCLNFDTV